jgi:hypothetical protein
VKLLDSTVVAPFFNVIDPLEKSSSDTVSASAFPGTNQSTDTIKSATINL